MRNAKLNHMIKGWFVGNFEPSLYKTNDVEVAVKLHKAGDKEEWHYHKIATEITAVIKGRVKMVGGEYCAGDIVVLEPGEGTEFEVMEDTIMVVVKIPCWCP